MKRLGARIGRRGSALLFFALLDLISAIAMLTAPQPLNPQYLWMASVMPLVLWAALWGGVGLLCLVYAFLHDDIIAFTAAISVKVAWGTLSLFGWLAGAVERGYVSAAIWFAFAAFVYLIAGGVPPAPPKDGAPRWIRY